MAARINDGIGRSPRTRWYLTVCVLERLTLSAVTAGKRCRALGNISLGSEN